ncbi:MAG: hypothetical protein ACYTGZ_13770 [Planctomycetota bacterium]
MEVDLDTIEGAVDRADRIPRLQARVVSAWIDAHVDEPDRPAAFDALVYQWLAELVPALGPGFRMLESSHTVLVTSQEDRAAELLLASADRAGARLQAILGWPEPEQSLVIAFAREAQYYDYISYSYPDEGEFPRSGGVCLSDDCVVHVALAPCRDLLLLEVVAAHEIAHALLSAIEVPAWVDEGVAQLAESEVAELREPGGAELVHELRDCFWPDGLDAFRAGDSFHEVDDRGRLSYELALLLVQSLLLRDSDVFRTFLDDASRADGGDAALRARYGISFEELARSCVGSAPQS